MDNKKIRLTKHALEQSTERGTSEKEIILAIRNGVQENARSGRKIYKYNFEYCKKWQNKYYSIKQVAPVVKEEKEEIIVITVFTFYF